jgi:hypothetical protein
MIDVTFSSNDLTLREMRIEGKRLLAAGKKSPFVAAVPTPVQKAMQDGSWDVRGFIRREKYGPWGEATAQPNEIGAIEYFRVVAQ